MPLNAPNVTCASSKGSFLDNLTSHLASHNPFAHAADPSKSFVWLLDNTAYRLNDSPKSPWQAQFVAAIFVQHSGRDASKDIAAIAEKLGLAKGDEAEKTISRRLLPLLREILPAKTINIAVGSEAKDSSVVHKMPPSDRSGITTDLINIAGTHADGSTINSGLDGFAASNYIGSTTTFAGPTGWAIISDIDDTIKRTLTGTASGILRTTFVEDPPQPIPGMPELYKYMQDKLAHPPIWYLSASPYNLYPFLRAFRNAHYPAGPLLLRDASWMNIAGFVSSLTQNTRDYKVNRMATDLQPWWPRREFVCLGDSTQSDPEAYAELYRRHPGWIRAIFIRKVQGVVEVADEITPGDQNKQRNAPERFEKAFQGVPRDIWTVFESPDELYAKVDGLVAAGLKVH